MTDTRQLTPAESQGFEEEWRAVMNTGGNYTLSGWQAQIIMQAMAQGKREVMFETFMIAIPYIAEFYRVRQFSKGTKKLPERASEKPYKPIPAKKWESMKKEILKKCIDEIDKKLK